MISELNYVSVGMENLDERNRVVIEKLVSSFRPLCNGVGVEQRDHILDNLLTELFFHFEGEAQTMREIAFPQFRQHDDDHKLYTSRAVDLYRQLREGWITPWEMLSYLFDDLCNHIVKFDSRYAAYLRDRNSQGCPLPESIHQSTSNFFG
jgi:hemerythrin-like metal-binding protein